MQLVFVNSLRLFFNQNKKKYISREEIQVDVQTQRRNMCLKAQVRFSDRTSD